ncbi:hypothetical protein MRX96_027353 [Rhipicephalus microplus]|uniref:Putative farnesoic acid o-methyltransferase midgut overexpressed n=1 Tax=Rhipicephalus microplus TaxID=6941 RepID=A0A6M2CI31_RHIMP|nr:uncharacterized protein LOC119177053 [Rhipicephalus microplus]KAH8020074.1 hypothetical protein HPB51_024156 [Rhipicephalus microplus]
MAGSYEVTNYRMCFEWVKCFQNRLPYHAVSAGKLNGHDVYVARAVHEGETLIGWAQPGVSCCNVSWGGGAHELEEYQCLATETPEKLDWVPAADGDVPNGAVQGGTTSDGEQLFVGRVHSGDNVFVGKVQPSHNALYVAHDGQEVKFNNYEVLVCKKLELC